MMIYRNNSLEDFKYNFLHWLKKKVEKPHYKNWSLCPYAKNTRLNNKIYFIDSRFKQVIKTSYCNSTIIIYWLGDDIDSKIMEENVLKLNKKYNDQVFFLATLNSNYFIKNISNYIIAQKKSDLLQKRNYLLQTDYYDFWPTKYFRQILGIYD